MFEMLTERLNGVFKQLRSRGRLSESNIDDAMREVRRALLEARRQLQGRPLIHRTGPRTRHRSGSPQKHHARAASRQSCPRRIDRAHGQPKCRLATRRIAPLSRHDGRPPGIGQNDLGGKIGPPHRLLASQNKNPLLVAADIYRPAAIDQLCVLGEQVNVPVHRAAEGTRSRRYLRTSDGTGKK